MFLKNLPFGGGAFPRDPCKRAQHKRQPMRQGRCLHGSGTERGNSISEDPLEFATPFESPLLGVSPCLFIGCPPLWSLPLRDFNRVLFPWIQQPAFVRLTFWKLRYLYYQARHKNCKTWSWNWTELISQSPKDLETIPEHSMFPCLAYGNVYSHMHSSSCWRSPTLLPISNSFPFSYLIEG